ncbi:MAG: hypothetical protein HQM13_02670 [SAR324 cluster bacterium]|nr:hypothetical protein [SAR324 cluster bacterium]
MKKNAWKWRFLLCGLAGFLFSCTDDIVFLVPNTSPFVNKNAALLVSKPTASIKPQLVRAITEKVEKRLAKFPSFSKLLLSSEVDSFLNQRIELKYKTVQYVATFVLTGVSDKDISTQLGKELGADQLLILDFSQYPCSNCESGVQLAVKLHLLEAASGDLLWRGRVHTELDQEEVEKEEFERIVIESTEMILDDFVRTFRIPWHYLRYEHLKKIEISPAEAHPS